MGSHIDNDIEFELEIEEIFMMRSFTKDVLTLIDEQWDVTLEELWTKRKESSRSRNRGRLSKRKIRKRI